MGVIRSQRNSSYQRQREPSCIDNKPTLLRIAVFTALSKKVKSHCTDRFALGKRAEGGSPEKKV